MPNLPEGQPAYGERDIGAILRRATELQAADETTAVAGVSLADLERATADVGIDPRYVRAAAAERERGPLAGPASLVEVRRQVPGEVTDEAWEEVVAELRRTFGRTGRVSRNGRAYEWQLKGDPDPETRPSIHVTVRPRAGSSEIEIVSSAGHFVTAGWLGGFAATLLTVLPLVKLEQVSLWLGLLLGAVMMTATFLATRAGLTSWLRRDRRKLTRLMDVLAARVQEGQMTPDLSSAALTGSAASEQEAQRLSVGR